MKQTGKKILPRLLALVLAFSLLPVQVLSAAVCLPGMSEAQTESKSTETIPADVSVSSEKAETDAEKSTDATETETESTTKTAAETEGTETENAAETVAETKGTETESSCEPETAVNAGKKQKSSYQLNITHRLRFYADGIMKQLDEKEVSKLTEDNFKNGSYDLSQHIFHREELSAQIQGSPQLNIKNLKADAACDIVILYTVKSGYKAVLKDSPAAGSSNVRPRSIYQGRFETVQFIPKKHYADDSVFVF